MKRIYVSKSDILLCQLRARVAYNQLSWHDDLSVVISCHKRKLRYERLRSMRARAMYELNRKLIDELINDLPDAELEHVFRNAWSDSASTIDTLLARATGKRVWKVYQTYNVATTSETREKCFVLLEEVFRYEGGLTFTRDPNYNTAKIFWRELPATREALRINTRTLRDRGILFPKRPENHADQINYLKEIEALKPIPSKGYDVFKWRSVIETDVAWRDERYDQENQSDP